MFCFCSNEMQPCRIWGAKQKLNPIANRPSPIANNPCLYTLHSTPYTLHTYILSPLAFKLYIFNEKICRFAFFFVPLPPNFVILYLTEYEENIVTNSPAFCMLISYCC